MIWWRRDVVLLVPCGSRGWLSEIDVVGWILSLSVSAPDDLS